MIYRINAILVTIPEGLLKKNKIWQANSKIHTKIQSIYQ